MALQILGYNRKDIDKVLSKIDENLPTEEIIKNALKYLSQEKIMEFTDEQKSAIYEKDSNILVAAAARKSEKQQYLLKE